jgi:glycosyltransferase involved in cell wall biosynthesis
MATRLKIVLFNRFFFPDTSATSQVLSDLAFNLAATGHDVHVVAGGLPGHRSKVEKIRGVSVHRVATAAEGAQSLGRKAAAYFAYYLGARRAARELIEPGSIAIFKTDPPLLSVAIGPLAQRRGAKVVVWLQDLFPEVAGEFGLPGMRGALGKLLRSRRDRSLESADRIVAIGDRMAARIAQCVPTMGERLEVIHNWADGNAIKPLDPANNPLRRRWNLENEFVVAYSGNLGRVHEFDTFLDAAARLQSEARITFLVIGRGPRLAEVKARARREGLANVRFEPHQSRDSLDESLAVADVHVSVLAPRFEGLVHPSKLYGIMAAGRPTLFVGDRGGETAAILTEAKAGISVDTGDADGFAAAILGLRGDRAALIRMGSRARRAFEERYDLPIAMARWDALLRSLDVRREIPR